MLSCGSLDIQALEHAGIGLAPEQLAALDLARCGILIGTAMGGMSTFSAAVEDLTQKARSPLCLLGCWWRHLLCWGAQPDTISDHRIHDMWTEARGSWKGVWVRGSTCPALSVGIMPLQTREGDSISCRMALILDIKLKGEGERVSGALHGLRRAGLPAHEPLLHPLRDHQHGGRAAGHGPGLHGAQLLHLHRLRDRQLLPAQVRRPHMPLAPGAASTQLPCMLPPWLLVQEGMQHAATANHILT